MSRKLRLHVRGPHRTVPGPPSGTRWLRRNGPHAGAEIEVDHTTDNAVFVREVGGGNAGGKQKLDQSQIHRLTLASFSSMYVAPAVATGAGNGYRKVHAKQAPAELPPVAKPLQLNGYVLRGATNLNIEVLTITPDMAKAWLERGGRNRKPIQRTVMRYAAAIRRGEWILTGDSIKLDQEQRVIDGQHRLLAIVASGVSITSLVVRNVEVEAQDVIDTGKSRTARDVLSMHGFKHSPTGVAAAAKMLMAIEQFGRPNASSRQLNVALSNATVLQYAMKHLDLVEGVERAYSLRQSAGFGGGDGLLGAFITLIYRAQREDADDFLEALESGANLEAGSPVLLLRTRLLNERHSGRGTGMHRQADRETLLAMCVKAWNLWRAEQPAKILIWRESEGFPKAV